MRTILRAGLCDLVSALSFALDFTARGLSDHHARIAGLSVRLGQHLGLDQAQLRDLAQAASLHDVGAVTFREKDLLCAVEVSDPWPHCERGERFLRGSELLGHLAPVVRCHHDRFGGGNPSGLSGRRIPLAARIIHLADRVDVMVDPSRFVLLQREEVLARLEADAGKVFDPEVLAAFRDLSAREELWLDLASARPGVPDERMRALDEPALGPEALLDVATLFSKLIDGRSRFTARHSTSVAAVASRLGELAGMGDAERASLHVAGLLHDLGKVSVPEHLLEKDGPLTPDEFALVKQHPYFTHRILSRIPGMETIRDWASFHHERLDGTGYPFRLKAGQLDLGARILAVADQYAALIEDRPYRRGLDGPAVAAALRSSARSGRISSELAELALANDALLRPLVGGAQARAAPRPRLALCREAC